MPRDSPRHRSASRSAAWSGSAATNAPLTAPMEVPTTMSGRTPASDSARSMPTSCAPSSPPPPSTNAVVTYRRLTRTGDRTGTALGDSRHPDDHLGLALGRYRYNWPARTPGPRARHARRNQRQVAEEGREVFGRVLEQGGRALAVQLEEAVRGRAVSQAHGEQHVAARRERGRVPGHQLAPGLDREEVQQGGHDQAGGRGQVKALGYPGEHLVDVTGVAVHYRQACLLPARQAAQVAEYDRVVVDVGHA